MILNAHSSIHFHRCRPKYVLPYFEYLSELARLVVRVDRLCLLKNDYRNNLHETGVGGEVCTTHSFYKPQIFPSCQPMLQCLLLLLLYSICNTIVDLRSKGARHSSNTYRVLCLPPNDYYEYRRLQNTHLNCLIRSSSYRILNLPFLFADQFFYFHKQPPLFHHSVHLYSYQNRVILP